MTRSNGWMAAVFFLFSLFLPPTLAAAGELEEVRAAIQAKNAQWTAAETSVSVLPEGARQKLVHSQHPAVKGDHAVLSYKAATQELPADLDWKNRGGNFVTPVKDRGACTSCWALAPTAALESHVLIHGNIPNTDLDLAEQILLSCSGAGDCETGGSIDGAADFIRDYGLPLESCYPYIAKDGSCSRACPDWQAAAYPVRDWGWVATTSPTVESLKKGLFHHGPLVTTLAVYGDFFSYAGGVYTHTAGSLAGLHAVTVIGYSDAGQYFIGKNSWGSNWGESGFFRISYSELANPVGFGKYPMAYVGEGDFALPPSGNGERGGKGKGGQGGSPRVGGFFCLFSLSAESQSFSGGGGTGSVSVIADPGCEWSAASNDSWIQILSGNTGDGEGVVSYTVEANPAPVSRTGTLTIADNTLTLIDGPGLALGGNCTYIFPYWKNHPEKIRPLLPLTLGAGIGSLGVSSEGQALDILKMKNHGNLSTAVAKLTRQLLTAKLNMKNGADGSAVAETIQEADQFLGQDVSRIEGNLGPKLKKIVSGWTKLLHGYNQGEIGPGRCHHGHCDGDESEDDDDDEDEDDSDRGCGSESSKVKKP